MVRSCSFTLNAKNYITLAVNVFSFQTLNFSLTLRTDKFTVSNNIQRP